MPWSLSQRNLYRKCPSAYDFRHNKRIPDPAGPAAARGTSTHALLEGYLLTGEWTSQLRPWTVAHAERMRRDGYQAELKLALDKDWKVVEWQSPEAWVRGVIDAFKEQPNLIHMGEWKTGKVWDDHVDQRRLYLVMALSAFPAADAAHISTIYVDQEFEASDFLKREDLAAHQKHWEAEVQPMLADTFFSPRPGQHCRWCAYSRAKNGPCPVA